MEVLILLVIIFVAFDVYLSLGTLFAIVANERNLWHYLDHDSILHDTLEAILLWPFAICEMVKNRVLYGKYVYRPDYYDDDEDED